MHFSYRDDVPTKRKVGMNGLLMFNALIQYNISSGGSDVGM